MNVQININGNQRNWSESTLQSRLDLIVKVYNRPDPSSLTLFGRIVEFVKVVFLNIKFWLVFGEEKNVYLILEQLETVKIVEPRILKMYQRSRGYFPMKNYRNAFNNPVVVPNRQPVYTTTTTQPVYVPPTTTSYQTGIPTTQRSTTRETNIVVPKKENLERRSGISARSEVPTTVQPQTTGFTFGNPVGGGQTTFNVPNKGNQTERRSEGTSARSVTPPVQPQTTFSFGSNSVAPKSNQTTFNVPNKGNQTERRSEGTSARSVSSPSSSSTSARSVSSSPVSTGGTPSFNNRRK
jgi:hypothetical protein